MEIIVSDTNIFIDLFKIGLLREFCSGPFNVRTTDLLINELKIKEQRSLVEKLVREGKIAVSKFAPNEIADILNLQEGNLSVEDCSALYCATKNDCLLLTGDKKLRTTAESRNIKVSGIFYVLDSLLAAKTLSEAAYQKALSLLSQINPRLPAKEFKKQLCKAILRPSRSGC